MKKTLDAILGRTNEHGYIVALPMVGTESLFKDGEIARKVNAAITYEVIGVQIDGTIAIATVFISAPDLSIIMEDAVSQLITDGSDNVDELLTRVALALSFEHDMFEDTVEVNMERLDNWFIVPSTGF